MVYLSPGTYLSSTVVLKSNVTLYLEAGALVLGNKEIAQYTLQAGPEANADANRRHLIFARNQENVSLCGPGTVDGPRVFILGAVRPPNLCPGGTVGRCSIALSQSAAAGLSHARVRELPPPHRGAGGARERFGWTMRLMSCVGVASMVLPSRTLLSGLTPMALTSQTRAMCESPTAPSTPGITRSA